MAFLSAPAAASEIKVIVNRIPITTYDIQRRAAFMKLQRRKGNLNELAEEEMIDQALRLGEAQRLGIRDFRRPGGRPPTTTSPSRTR